MSKMTLLLRLNNNKGFALIVTYLLVVMLFVMGTAFFAHSFSERKIVQVDRDNTIALNLAEAGLSRAIDYMRNNFTTIEAETLDENGEFSPLTNQTLCANFTLGNCTGSEQEVGSYQVNIDPEPGNFIITAEARAGGNSEVLRTITATIDDSIPSNFYNNAIYSSGEVDLNGNAYAVKGDIVYYSSIDNTGNVDGVITQDDSASPLLMLNFDELYTQSALQGNVYDSQRLQDVRNGIDSFPTSFYNIEPGKDAEGNIIRDADGKPVDPGTPNFVYIEDDLVLNGNIGTIGGFFIVAGDVLNSPSAQYDVTANGNGQIDGCIYTRGEFTINGGGGNLNVNGGVWAGTEARLNGNATVTFNLDYMAAIEQGKHIKSVFQMVSWGEMPL